MRNFLPCHYLDRLFYDPKYESTIQASVDQKFAISEGLKAADQAIRKAAVHWQYTRVMGLGEKAQIHAVVVFASACHALKIGPGDM